MTFNRKRKVMKSIFLYLLLPVSIGLLSFYSTSYFSTKTNKSLLWTNSRNIEEPETNSETFMALLDKKAWNTFTRNSFGLFVKLSDKCDSVDLDTPDEDDIEHFSGTSAYVLNGKKNLIVINCYLGAYNPLQNLYLYDKSTSSSEAISLDHYFKENNQLKKEVLVDIPGNISFNKTAQELSVYSKSRGLGDCGYLDTYKFQDDSFDLVKGVARECDENQLPVSDDEWPVIYKRV